MTLRRAVLVLISSLAIVPSASAGHTLTSQQQKVLASWLTTHRELRVATDADCKCDEDIEQMKKGAGGKWLPVPDYHPYVATGDFNGDGITDFAVVLIDNSKSVKHFELVVFNGPFRRQAKSPAFIQSGLEGDALFFGPPRPKPYRLVIGPFESEGAVLIPHDQTYKLQADED